MKRILLITTTPFYQEKGSSLRVFSILSMLSEKYAVDVVTYSVGREIVLKNIMIFRTPSFFKPKLLVSRPTFSKIVLDFFVFLKAFRLLITRKYDIIHCEDFEAAFIGIILNRIFKKRLVYDLHNRIIDNLSISGKTVPSFIIFLEKRVIINSDLIIANWELYLNDPVFKNSDIFLQYDSVDLKTTEIELPVSRYIFYVGNFEKYQGVKEFLEIYLDSQCIFPLIMAGNPTEEITTFVTENGLSSRVFLMGKKTVQETNYLIKNSIYCILPRISGRQPSMKLIHYFLWLKPVIATNKECNTELLKDKYNGFLYNDKKGLIEIFKNIKNVDNLKKLEQGIRDTSGGVTNFMNASHFLKEYE